MDMASPPGAGRAPAKAVGTLTLIIPLLVAGASATTALMQENWPTYWDWAGLMAAFNAIYIVLSIWLFKPVVESSEG